MEYSKQMASYEENTTRAESTSTSTSEGAEAEDDVALKYLAGPPPEDADPEQLLDYTLWLTEDQQVLKAADALDRLEAHADLGGAASLEAGDEADGESPASRAVAQMLAARGLPRDKMRTLRRYAEASRVAKAEFDDDDGWTVVHELFGVKTYFKMLEGEQSIHVKMEGELKDLSMICLASALREIDLYSSWLPFCITSIITQWKGRCDVLAQFALQVPFMYRDCFVHAFLCDTIHDDGSFMLVGGSPLTGQVANVDDVVAYEGTELPPCDKSWSASWGSAARMDVKAFKAQFTQVSGSTVRARIVACVDPVVPLPTPIVNFCVKHIAGVVLSLLALVARRIQNNPEKSEHAKRIRTDPFYSEFLIPKCNRFYDAMGWKRTVLFQRQAGSGGDAGADEEEELERIRRDGDAAAAEAEGSWFAMKGLVGKGIGAAGGVWERGLGISDWLAARRGGDGNAAKAGPDAAAAPEVEAGAEAKATSATSS